MTSGDPGELAAGIEKLFRDLVADVTVVADEEIAGLRALGPTFAGAPAEDDDRDAKGDAPPAD